MFPVRHFRSATHLAVILTGATTLITATTGCISVHRELAAEEQRRQVDWQQRHATAQLARAAPLRLAWDDALVLLRRGNEKIRAVDLDCLRASENLQQVRRSLLPLLSLQGGYNQALTSGTGIDPFTFAASVFFDVPGMVGYRLRHEAAELVVIRSQLALEAVWREQTVELYRAFSHCAQLAGDRRNLARALAAATGPGSARFRTLLEHRLATLVGDEAEASTKLSHLVGQPDVVFDCTAAGLPALAYEQPANRPAATAIARLPLRLAAVELVALRARELGVNLEYWPEFSVYVSNPSLYRRNDGQNTYWSSRDMFAGANAYLTLDTRGRIASQKRIVAAETRLRRETLEREAATLSHRIETALVALSDTDVQLAALPAAGSTPSTLFQTAVAARRTTLLEERRDWQLVLWFFDDARWPGVPPLTPSPAPAT